MFDTIDRDKAIKELVQEIVPVEDTEFYSARDHEMQNLGLELACMILHNMDSSYKRGKWVYTTVDSKQVPICSACRRQSDSKTNFCSYCGADMRDIENTNKME